MPKKNHRNYKRRNNFGENLTLFGEVKLSSEFFFHPFKKWLKWKFLKFFKKPIEHKKNKLFYNNNW